MRTTTVILSMLCGGVLAMTSCSNGSSGGGGGGSDPFVGTYSCTNSYTWTFTTPAGWPPYNGSNAYTNVVADDGNGTLTTTISTDAGATCTLKHSYSGDTSTLESGQTCTFGTVTYTYSGGTGTLSGNSIASTSTYAFSGTVQVDGGTVSVSGNGTGSSACTKQ